MAWNSTLKVKLPSILNHATNNRGNPSLRNYQYWIYSEFYNRLAWLFQGFTKFTYYEFIGDFYVQN